MYVYIHVRVHVGIYRYPCCTTAVCIHACMHVCLQANTGTHKTKTHIKHTRTRTHPHIGTFDFLSWLLIASFRSYVCIYICIYAYTHMHLSSLVIFMYPYIHKCIHTHRHLWLLVLASNSLFSFICMYLCIVICSYVCIYILSYVHMYVSMYCHMYVSIYT